MKKTGKRKASTSVKSPAKKTTAKAQVTTTPAAGKTSTRKKTDTAPEVDPRFAVIMDSFAKTKDVTAGMMMASFGLKVRGKIFAMFVRGEFVAKLPKARVDELARAGKGTNFDPGGRGPMKEWISIPGDESSWLALAKEAHRFVLGGA